MGMTHDGDLVRYRIGEIQSVASNEMGNTRQIRDLIVDPDGTVWGTTLDELFGLREMTRKNPGLSFHQRKDPVARQTVATRPRTIPPSGVAARI